MLAGHDLGFMPQPASSGSEHAVSHFFRMNVWGLGFRGVGFKI